MFQMIRRWCMALVLFSLSYGVADELVIEMLDSQREEVICNSVDGIRAIEKNISIDKIELYIDEKNNFNVPSYLQLLSVTMTVENLTDEDIFLDSDYLPIRLTTNLGDSVELRGLMDSAYSNYDLKDEYTQVMVPIGRERQVTYLIEVDSQATALICSYSEFSPTYICYQMKMPLETVR